MTGLLDLRLSVHAQGISLESLLDELLPLFALSTQEGRIVPCDIRGLASQVRLSDLLQFQRIQLWLQFCRGTRLLLYLLRDIVVANTPLLDCPLAAGGGQRAPRILHARAAWCLCQLCLLFLRIGCCHSLRPLI